ncbi:hypothetical protein [Micromonospora coerulea]|uniref:hypothetical protein n=1 Tax=Micromonospora coerulea TaxID=47856 RepID=UPI001902E6A9|nr:hypothetical protein [Micromonospora veneta]
MTTTCCGQRIPGTAGGPLVLACQLCPHSPTYWRGPDARQPVPPADERPAVPAAEQPARVLPAAPNPPAVQPGRCGAGVTPCGTAPARLYPCGWRCEEHRPSNPRPEKVPPCCRGAEDGACEQHRQQARVLGHRGLRRRAPAQGNVVLGDPGTAKPAADGPEAA